MAVQPTEISYFQSLETDSLGGAISVTTVPVSLNGWYSDINLAEATAGSTAYRCMYIKNESASDTLTGTVIYIATPTPCPSTHVELALGTSGLNGTEQVISSENIAPVGTTFVAPTVSVPLVIGDLAAGEYYPIWVKRVTTALAVGTSNDSVVFAVTGDGGV